MKKLLLSMIILLGLNTNAQTLLFEDSFEFETDFAITGVGDWTLLDVDLGLTYGIQYGTAPNFLPYVFANSGVAKSFQVFNAATVAPPLVPQTPGTTGSNWSARTGDRHMVCFASSQPTAAPLNNDWLISPQITLGTGNVIKFWAKPCSTAYGAERFKVSISTTGTVPANFTKISTGAFITTPVNTTWVEYSVTIPASYNNLPVYIGIHCTSPDMFGFAVDDFSVTGTVLATDTFFSQNFAVSPNPANDVLNFSNKTNTLISNISMTDVNGRVVKQINNEVNQIDISELNSGVYFLKITSDIGVASTKIIKR